MSTSYNRYFHSWNNSGVKPTNDVMSHRIEKTMENINWKLSKSKERKQQGIITNDTKKLMISVNENNYSSNRSPISSPKKGNQKTINRIINNIRMSCDCLEGYCEHSKSEKNRFENKYITYSNNNNKNTEEKNWNNSLNFEGKETSLDPFKKKIEESLKKYNKGETVNIYNEKNAFICGKNKDNNKIKQTFIDLNRLSLQNNSWWKKQKNHKLQSILTQKSNKKPIWINNHKNEFNTMIHENLIKTHVSFGRDDKSNTLNNQKDTWSNIIWDLRVNNEDDIIKEERESPIKITHCPSTQDIENIAQSSTITQNPWAINTVNNNNNINTNDNNKQNNEIITPLTKNSDNSNHSRSSTPPNYIYWKITKEKEFEFCGCARSWDNESIEWKIVKDIKENQDITIANLVSENKSWNSKVTQLSIQMGDLNKEYENLNQLNFKMIKRIDEWTANKTIHNTDETFVTTTNEDDTISPEEKIRRYKLKIIEYKEIINTQNGVLEILKRDYKTSKQKLEDITGFTWKFNKLYDKAFAGYRPRSKEDINSFKIFTQYWKEFKERLDITSS